ncbi:aspartate/glutamate racemase family protein [Crenobacter sp. SG2303]|uniref:Aspartate/glutamate racemase family protein n=1 Tax=Crenobacter oryzisoli TaxID=3056844 RepID=A0ABT7XLS4_9NEIS|nr:aspartate/glutamate racemase family protein [Crenobacter sp. SG2303]MDN0074728.1 aspartate/glutamate racemase family protein [Crenobacter sp. SG2303]
MNFTHPIAVFDAGIGSYQIARKIAKRYPTQDIVYFADRASFPYGGKGRAELLATLQGTLARLADYRPAAVVVASNAPSVMVLDDLRATSAVPLIGVFPPVRQALAASRTGHVAVLGVDSLVESAEIRAYVAGEASGGRVELVAASDLVALVESGAFVSDPDGTLAAVRAKLAELPADIDVITLSSTHLPWLANYFAAAAPALTCLDPADTVVEALAPHVRPGSGAFVTLVSSRPGYDLAGFREMTARLGIELAITPV